MDRHTPTLPNVYFIVDKRFLQKRWPELLENPQPFLPEERPERIVSGLDCWPILTWTRLCAHACPFVPVLTTHAVDDAVCVFHWDNATPRFGVHRCFAVVVQADRPPSPLADMVILQNGLCGESALQRHIPLWPQPGLIPRDPARGTRLTTVAYLGSDQYEPHFVREADFQEALARRNVRFVNRFQGHWHDYREIDAVLAIRDCPPVVLATKPASKLVNAWLTGVPALLGEEPAYQELRQSPLDYLETRTARDVLDAIDRLQGETGLYAGMVANGFVRAADYSVPLLAQRWTDALSAALAANENRKIRPGLRRLNFTVNNQKMRLLKRLTGWRD